MKGRVRGGENKGTIFRTKGEGKPGKTAWICTKPVRDIPGSGTFLLPYLFRAALDFFNRIMDQVQDLLVSAFYILCIRCDNENQIRIRIKKDILAPHAIHGKPIPDAPELISVSMLFICSLTEMNGRNLKGNCLS